MNPANALSNVVLPEPLATSEHERLTGRDRERQTVDNAAAPALYDQVFSNELHRDEFPRMGEWRSDGGNCAQCRRYNVEGFTFAADYIKGRLYPSLAQKRESRGHVSSAVATSSIRRHSGGAALRRHFSEA